MFSTQMENFDYLVILKNNLEFQKKNENKDCFLSIIDKEIAISHLNQNITKNNEDMEEKICEMDNKEVLGEETDLNIQTDNDIVKEEIPITLPTTVIQTNNLPENYDTIYRDVKIKNETNFNLSQEILNPDVEFSNKSDVIIFHTHTCESYTQTKENSYIASRKL